MNRWSTSPSHARTDYRSRGPSTYDDCLQWIADKKTSLQSARYPFNRRRLQQAIEAHRQTAAQIDDLRQDVDRVLSRTYDEGKKKALENEYSSLKEISDKKLGCITTMLDITALEENCGTLSHEMDMKATALADVENRHKSPGGGSVADHIRGFLSPSAKDCIFGVQDNWDWIVKLVKCVDIHLKNGSQYHQFFHEVEETEHLLQDDLDQLQALFDDKHLSGKEEDATKLLKEIEDISVALRQWESRVDRLWERGTHIVPVHLRTGGVTGPTPARALTDYDTDEIRIREGEDLQLLDNTDSHTWRVRNCHGDEGDVPALTVLIPGPYKEAVDAAVNMRLKLLTTWTNAIKRLGKRLITYMLLIFKPEYDEEEIRRLRQVRKLDKQELMRILDVVEDTLKHHWADHEGFTNLQERILALRMILDNIDDKKGVVDDDVYNTILVQITGLEELMGKYKDLWNNWECYKTALEASQAPDLMLVVDKWEQLQYVTRAYFSKFWKNQLPMEEFEKSLHNLQQIAMNGSKRQESVDEDLIEEQFVSRVEHRPKKARSQLGQVDITIALGAEPTRMEEVFEQTTYSQQPHVSMMERPAPKLRTANVSMQNALGTPESLTEDSGWSDTRTVDSRITIEGERQQAPKMRMAQLNMRSALGAPETVVLDTLTGDNGWTDTRTVDSQIIIEGEMQRAPTMSMAAVSMQNTLESSPESVTEDSGWSDIKTVDSRITVEGRREQSPEMFTAEVSTQNMESPESVSEDSGWSDTRTVDSQITIEGERQHAPMMHTEEVSIQGTLETPDSATEDSSWSDIRTVHSQITIEGQRQHAPIMRTEEVINQGTLETPESGTEDSSWSDIRTVDSQITIEGQRQHAPIMRTEEVSIQGTLETTPDSATEDSSWSDIRTVDSQITIEGERQHAPKMRAAQVSMQGALGSPESLTEDSEWSDTRTVDSRITVEGERQQAPKMRMAQVNLRSALGAPETVVDESVTEDSGWSDSRTVDSRITIEGDRQMAPKMRTAQVNMRNALGVPETVVQDSGWSDMREVDSRITVEGERPMRRARAGRVDLMDALGNGGSGGSGGSGESRLVTANLNYVQPMNGTLHAGAEMFEEGMDEEGVVENRAVYEALMAAECNEADRSFGYATETRTAETEQLENIEVDEKKLFVIRSVVDPTNNTDVSLQEAILNGIIRPHEGCYCNPDTNEAMPIPMAMANGLIRVEYTSTRRGAERRSTIGIITVKTIREAVRPYNMLSVTDTSSREKITQQEAEKREILNVKHGIYLDKKSKQRMLMTEAIDKGLIDVEYIGEAPAAEVISKTYAVRAVVDRRRKATVTFAEAARRGIIDKETGAFRDTLTGDSMYVGDAIARGFLKARQIDNPRSMDIDPENKMIIDKTETIRKKLLRPLGVISAFKNAAKSAEKRRSRSSASSTGSVESES